MFRRVLNTFFSYYLVCVIAFEDIIYAYGEETSDMSEKGKIQYQLLQERGHLPQYGNCWKNAIRTVDEGCRNLSEDTQSEIALRLTNCFLEMSGHETYSCDSDKKPNLRGICINTMSDRAFNVYTEFYTHTQNICFFLRGQIWHETIAESTDRLGRRLHESARNQMELLEIQKESLKLQRDLKEFYEYLGEKQKGFEVLSGSFEELRSWLLGEISWFDSMVFYFISGTMIMFVTSLKRTSSARFYMLIIISLNALIERIIINIISNRIIGIFDSHRKYYNLIWFTRYLTLILLSVILLYKFFTYKNYLVDNNELLQQILDKLNTLNNKINSLGLKDNLSVVSDFSPLQKSNNSFLGNSFNDVEKPNILMPRNSVKRDNINVNNVSKSTIDKVNKTTFEVRYNLRNRSATPEVIQKSI